MRQPLISIYTPTYNRAKLLIERAIPSVLNQTYKNFEYIIVSDGSTDNTKELVESIDDPRIRFYEIEIKYPPHDYNTEIQWYRGASIPANYALDLVKGDYIARLDDDEIWSKNHLETSLQFLLNGNYDFITSQYSILWETHVELKELPYIQDYLRINDPTKQNCKIGCHSSWFYKAELRFFKYNPECYKKEWNRVNDIDLLERLFKVGVRIGFKPDATVYIKPRPNEKEIGLKAVRERMK